MWFLAQLLKDHDICLEIKLNVFVVILIGFLYLLMEGHYKFLQLFGFFVLIWIFFCQSFFLQAIENFCLFKWNYGTQCSLSVKNAFFFFILRLFTIFLRTFSSLWETSHEEDKVCSPNKGCVHWYCETIATRARTAVWQLKAVRESENLWCKFVQNVK